MVATVGIQVGKQVPITPNNAFQGYVASFGRHLKAENKSPKTIQSYTEAARLFGTYMRQKGMPSLLGNIKREHIEDWMVHLLRVRKPATAASRFRSLQQFFLWAREEGEVKETPMLHMKPPKIGEVHIPVLNLDQIAALLKACDGPNFEDRRDYAMMRFFAVTGARRQEVADLKISDIDLDRGVAILHGKGDRSRPVALDPKLVRAIDRYLRKRSEHNKAALPWLWLSRGGGRTKKERTADFEPGRLTHWGAEQILDRRAKKAGLPRLHLHQLRHSFVNAMLTDPSKVNEGDLMKLLGWRSRQMLDRYASAVAQDRAVAAHRKVAFVNAV